MFKFKQCCPTDMLKSLYYTIFYLHMLYCPLTTNKNLMKISILTNQLFLSNNILKFQDIIKCEQMKLVFQFKNKDLPNELNELFIFKHEISNYETCLYSKC